MTSARKSAVTAGVFFIIAAVAGIAGLVLYDPILSDSRFIVDGSADQTRVLLGALFEVIAVISIIGTAAALYSVVRRYHEGIAIGYVAGRVLEAVVITVGIISLLSVVTLRHDLSSAANAGPLGQALVAIHDWTFLLGPGFAIGVNTLLLAYLMYRSGLVPRAIAVIGLVGGPLIFASSTAELFGAYDQVSGPAALAAIPVFAWEMSLAVWLIAKGFRSTARHADATQKIGMDPLPA